MTHKHLSIGTGFLMLVLTLATATGLAADHGQDPRCWPLVAAAALYGFIASYLFVSYGCED